MDRENVENDTKTVVWTENILSVFKVTRGLVWTGP